MGSVPLVKDQFWEMANKLPLTATIPLESTDEEDNHKYLILFDNHLKREEDFASPRSVLRIEKGEVPCSKLKFESKTQTNHNRWLVSEGASGVTKRM